MSQQNPVATVAKKNELRTLIETPDFKHAIAKALPKHLTPDRFVRVAATAMLKTPKLMQCDRTSFINSLLTLSQLGLEPDGRLAHLIPFENRKFGRVDCQLIIDYKGLAELVLRSGAYTAIHADKICENDDFEYNCGQVVRHKINFKQPRGAAYAYYAMATPKEGNPRCEVMTRDEVDSIRARSRAGNSGPWVTDYDEMAKKTVFRRLSKWLRSSPELADALEADADSQPNDAAIKEAGTVVDIAPAAVVPAVTKDDLAEAVAPENVVDMPASSDDDNVPFSQQPIAPVADPKPKVAPRKEKPATQVAQAPIATTASEKPAAPETDNPQQQLRAIVESAGYTLAQMVEVAAGLGVLEGKVETWDAVPDAVARQLIASKRGLLMQLGMLGQQ